jgi:hypothetical protein
MTCPSIRSPSAEHDVDVAKASNALAQCALQAIGRRFPHKLDHLILNAQDVLLPTDLHPIFDGSYDWHSSVHMHWSLLVLRQIGVDTTTELAIKERFDSTFTPALVQRELDYVRTPGRGSFERPYGLAWLLKLQTELDGQSQLGRVDAARWGQALRPLTEEVAAQLSAYLANLHYPVRAGTHANTAFSMLLANDYAIAAGDERLGQVVKMRALAWFAGDRAYPARYEPSGSDFLSPGLCEALLMKRTLPFEEFAAWWKGFASTDLSAWESPAVVSDRTDAQIVHLDGLNLSRAWCLRGLALNAESLNDKWLAAAATVASTHWRAAWPHITVGDFVATHWLVSFALLR